MKKLFIIAIAMLSLSSIYAIERDTYTRILWDRATHVDVCSGVYGRVKLLPNGDLLLVTSVGRDIITTRSKDGGETWLAPDKVTSSQGRVYFTNAEALVLQNGDIILGWNERVDDGAPEEYVFSISCQISKDNGQTWGNPIRIHTGLHPWGDGCWEPNFLQLPNGDIQCYFANEGPFTRSAEQEISMCTSKDGGKTWSSAIRVCYRTNCRDGMPVACLLEDGKTIAVAIEDNGTHFGGGFKPSIVRTTTETCWTEGYVDGNSSRRNTAFDEKLYSEEGGGAPYLVKLPTGETAVSWQCKANGRGTEDMFCAVGDKDARHFHNMTQPFHSASSTQCLWNSLEVLDENTIMACGSAGGLRVRKGYLFNKWHANYCPIYIDGKWDKTNEKWYDDNAAQAVLGNPIDSRWMVDLAYSKHYLNVYVKVSDRNIVSDKKSYNDGIRIQFDLTDVCSELPEKGVFEVAMDVNNTIVVKRGNAEAWKEDESLIRGIWGKTEVTTTGYTMEIAIPWTLLGVTDLSQVKGGMSVDRIERTSSDCLEDGVPGSSRVRPYTWLPLVLGPMPGDVKNNDDIFDYDNVLTDLPTLRQQSDNQQTFNLMGQPVPAKTKGLVIENNVKYFNR